MGTKYTKIYVVGSDDFDNYRILKNHLDAIIKHFKELYPNNEPIIIYSNESPVDNLCGLYVKKHKLSNKVFVPNYDRYKYNNDAFDNMEEKIFKYIKSKPGVGVLLCFWDGEKGYVKDVIADGHRFRMMMYIINKNIESEGIRLYG